MTNSAPVYPKRNLGSGEAWGREVENRIAGVRNELVQVSQSLNNSQRSTSGQLAVISRQIDEIATGRRSHTVSIPNRTLGTTAPGTYPSYSQTFVLPGPYKGSRSATLNFGIGLRKTSGPSGQNFNVWFEVFRGGEFVFRSFGSISVGATASAPPNWENPTVSQTANTIVPPGDHTYTITFYTTKFVTTAMAGIAENMLATITYGDLV